MIAQKEIFVPTVDTVPVTAFDATSDFTTDFIDFPMSLKDWSLQTTFDGVVTGAELTILVSNTWDGSYVPYSSTVKDLDMTIEDNLIIYDMIMPVRYMKLQYVAGTTTGNISFVISK